MNGSLYVVTGGRWLYEDSNKFPGNPTGIPTGTIKGRAARGDEVFIIIETVTVTIENKNVSGTWCRVLGVNDVGWLWLNQ